MLLTGMSLMVCSHWATSRPIKEWVIEICVEVFIPTPAPTQMQLGFKPIVSVPVSVNIKSVSVSGSVNTP